MAVAEVGVFTVEVETASAGVFVAVNEMTGFTGGKTRDVRSVRVFMRSTPRKMIQSPDRTFTLTGLLDLTDPGQLRIRAQEIAGLPVNFKVRPAGDANGYTITCLVNSVRHEASADGDYQTWSVECTPTADPVIAGTGPILI